MKHNSIAAVIVLASMAALPCRATYTAQRAYSFTTDAGRNVTVEVLRPDVVRVSNALPGEQAGPSVALTPSDSVALDVARAGQYLWITTSEMTVTVNRSSGAVTFDGGAGSIVADNGQRTVQADGQRRLELYTTATGAWYGAGERGHKLDLRGDTLVMFNRQNYGYTEGDARINQMNITMPLAVSADGFALLFDDFAASTMALTDPVVYTSESIWPVSYYYIKGGNDMDETMEALTAITGRQPLPPLWTLGYITSKYGYRTQQETLGVIDTLKREGYPVDGVVLDLYWYGVEEDMGRLAWDPKQWPNPRKMLKHLADQGVNTVIISQPYILRNGRGVDNYHELADGGMLVADTHGNPLEVKIWVGEGGMFDVSNPATRAWMANRYRELTDMGVGGWWGDLGEPEVHPDSAMHANGLTQRQYHNLYGNDWSSIIAELFVKEYPDRRLMTMMRGGTTGLQRFSVFPWSTDVSRSWGGMQPQVKIMLNSGLSGLGYMGHDVGGFAVEEGHERDDELYVRWLQLGIFSPMLRTHAQQLAEPYNYPRYESIIKHYIRERYLWLPYNYTLAYQNALWGAPMVRPLNYYDSSDAALANVTDEYLWGPDVLVAPVMQQGATQRDVVLPAGRWVDYNDPSKVYQGRIEAYPAPLAVLPLFVREGAIIPQWTTDARNTGDYRADSFTIKVYATGECEGSFSLYDDNKITPNTLVQEQYRLLNMAMQRDAAGNVTFDAIVAGDYQGAPRTIEATILIYGVGSATDYTVAATGAENARAVAQEVDGGVQVKVRIDTRNPFQLKLTK